MADSPLRFAAIGLDHRHIYRQVGRLLALGCECAGFWTEGDPQPLGGFLERFPDLPRADGPERLSDGPELDAVDICATPMAHGPLIEAAAAAGKDILVEKPLCQSPSEARAIVESVERHGVHLMVGYKGGRPGAHQEEVVKADVEREPDRIDDEEEEEQNRRPDEHHRADDSFLAPVAEKQAPHCAAAAPASGAASGPAWAGNLP